MRTILMVVVALLVATSIIALFYGRSDWAFVDAVLALALLRRVERLLQG